MSLLAMSTGNKKERQHVTEVALSSTTDEPIKYFFKFHWYELNSPKFN